jgi:hypothetical protein
MNELHLIFSDWGVMIIFFLAGLLYPLLYNLMYLNGVMSDTPDCCRGQCRLYGESQVCPGR